MAGEALQVIDGRLLEEQPGMPWETPGGCRVARSAVEVQMYGDEFGEGTQLDAELSSEDREAEALTVSALCQAVATVAEKRGIAAKGHDLSGYLALFCDPEVSQEMFKILKTVGN